MIIKKSELIQDLREIYASGGYGAQGLHDPEYDGVCPCFEWNITVDGKPFRAMGRCWRVSRGSDYQDLHYSGDIEIAKALKHCINKQDWYKQYWLIKGEFP